MIQVTPRHEPGVNLIGFLYGELGLGEIARKMAAALDRAEIPFAAIPYRRTPSRQEHLLELPTSSTARYDTNLVCLNADELVPFSAHAGTELFADRYSIGLWFWETSVFSDPRQAWLLLDEIWAPSEYVRQAVAEKVGVPVQVVPIPIEEPPRPNLTRTDVGLPEGFVFLFVFDFASAERKNPTAVVEAFRRAFAPGEGPSLVLKSINGRERKPRQLHELRAAAADRPDVHVVDGYVSVAERDAYVALCDCFVSLHRSEGLGLTMAEAMSHGKPVIATGYSGNLELMDHHTAHLVPHRLVPVPESWWAYAPGAEWAEPDVEAAAGLMRRVYEDQAGARQLGVAARAAILERFSVERAADFARARFDAVRRESLARSERASLVRAVGVVNEGPDQGLSGARGPVGLLRRALARVLWPQLEEQHRFDREALEQLVRARVSTSERAETD